MNLYPVVRPLLFCLGAETAHGLTVAALARAGRSGLLPATASNPSGADIEVMGLRFPNRIGLAAGLDKNAEAVDGLASLGFGFLEVGTVTPLPQPGNAKPRLFRLPAHQAIINRMGFNNAGVDALVAHVCEARFRGILGINIGKNAATPIDRAAEDYLAGLDRTYPYASYVTVNISSPNTKNLRQLQGGDDLDALLHRLKARQEQLTDHHGRYVPLVLKIAPDLDSAQLQHIATELRRHRIDGVIATNTTVTRDAIGDDPLAKQAGGLSGAPLFARSTAIVKQLAVMLAGEVPIIAAGGICRGPDVVAKLDAGAALVQIYSGLIFRGPRLVTECRAAAHAWATHAKPQPA